MGPNVTVSVNEKGHAVMTHAMPLVDYCVHRAQTLRAMVEALSAAKFAGDGGCAASSALAKPLMELIRTQVSELEPLFKTLDQRAYEKGFEDARIVGGTKRGQLESVKDPVVAA